MRALLFGSISTLADTSELQREAFNRAFAEHGLDWRWDRDDYRSMLGRSGGQARVAEYARERGETVDAAAVHATKSAAFQQLVADRGVEPRPGVVETVEQAKAAGAKVGFVTTTSPANIAALLDALSPALTPGTFDVIVDSDAVGSPKPDGASYRYALERLGVEPTAAVAVEDNPEGVQAATDAGVRCVAFPNANTAVAEFPTAALRVEQLDIADLRPLAAA